MSDYINKEDALDVFESIMHSLNENRFKSPSGLLTELYGKIHGVGLCRDIIKHAPTIDAVQVVRCKDCKWYELDSMESVDGMPLIVAHEICCFWGNGCKTNPNGFCSFAERKDDEID